ncbi:WD40-repeat-containing domain protein [Suillus subalutaceus]|uniref:WD40-repeat-containing domain protein n=1 Tax=Suillus subalutaceus TaxID=48586 RepID=UPI001B8832EA|nr:WD40-repeat-containing domain protein [Suillus subalutaceus]KAG1860168.1 WD40-repeat-containing domain protein [Suillus subalutaceus]
MSNNAVVPAERDQKPSAKGYRQALGSRREPFKIFEGHRQPIRSIATLPDGLRIATGSWDRTICIWRLEDGAEMVKWQVKKNIGSLVISQHGKHVVSAEGLFPSADDIHTEHWKLWVRDAESGKVVAGPLDTHTNVVRGLDVSPDGEILANGSWDHTMILWDTRSWQRKGGPIWCRLYVLDVRFSPSGQLGIATKEDIQIWDLERTGVSCSIQGPC